MERIEGRFDKLDARLNKVDGRFDKLDERLAKFREDVLEMKGRVSQLPTTVQLIGFVLAVLAISGALNWFKPH